MSQNKNKSVILEGRAKFTLDNKETKPKNKDKDNKNNDFKYLHVITGDLKPRQ